MLHNLASNLAECGHQPLAQFLEIVAFHNVWIWPDPLPPTETSAVRRVLRPANEATTGTIPPIGFISRSRPGLFGKFAHASVS
jgi:hypothetical protein